MTQPTHTNDSPPWSRNAKAIVAVAALALAVLIFYQFRSLVRYLIIAAILSYILNPIINLIHTRTPLKRTTTILVVYLGLLALIVWGAFVLGVAGYNQVIGLRDDLPNILSGFLGWIEGFSGQTYVIGTFEINTPVFNGNEVQEALLTQLAESWRTLLQSSDDVVGGVASVTFSTITALSNFLLIFIFSIYITFDLPRLGSLVGDFAHSPGYRKDAERLNRNFGRIWRAYLRGQITLALAMWLIVWITLLLMGVNNAFALGLLSGLMEFLPIIGAFIGAIAAVAVALFQPENWMGLSGWQLAAVVGVVMLIIQQLENNILVPRIVGQALDLHPLVTMVAVIMGASIAGILGAVLAAPVTATLKLLSTYGWRKMFDQDPFPDPEETDDDDDASVFVKARNYLRQMGGGASNSAETKPDKTAQT